MKARPTLANPADVVLTFLASVGRPADTEFYLRLFRRLPRESFAVIAVEPRLLAHTVGSVAEQLAFLRELGLAAAVVVGLRQPDGAVLAAERLADRLSDPSATLCASTDGSLLRRMSETLRSGGMPILAVDQTARTLSGRFDWLAGVAAQLKTRKIVVLHPRGGLGPRSGGHLMLGENHFLATHEGGISVVNLTTDYEPLLASGLLESPDDRQLLECLHRVLTHPGCEGAVANVASPLTLLSELFTVKGAGTLIKRGTRIIRHAGYDTLDQPRLASLVASSFSRALDESFFARIPQSIYIEEHYRGAAIVEPTAHGPFLTKFAVDRAAQGEGIGRDLWQAMTRDHPRLFWRGRKKNPIAGWYASLCDGMVRSDPWVVYWRGIETSRIPAVIDDAQTRADDFLPAI